MKFKKSLLLCFAILSVAAQAGDASSLIDYQLYRDFAMNRGQFKVGATNIKIPRKDGTFKEIKFVMPDFSSTDSTARGTLLDPGYIGGVRHNSGLKNLTFGEKAGDMYKIIDRNNHSQWDLHAPRLNKLVTEVPTLKVAKNPKVSDYEVFVRVGSGRQQVVNEKGEVSWISGSYQYLTGGIISADQMNPDWTVNDRGNNFNSNAVPSSPLPTNINLGDSGSPLLGLNKKTGKWEVVGFATAIGNGKSYYATFSEDFLLEKMAEDTLVFETKGTEEIIWGKANINNGNKGNGTISQGENSLTWNGLKNNVAPSRLTDDEFNHGKNIVFSGEDGTIKLEDSVSQGAGKLHFKGNYTVTSDNKNNYWFGAGVQVDEGKTVLWQIKGVKGDELHKVGEGTLHINGIGKNEGYLNIGDGLVILDQQADEHGNVQAFNSIKIVSGRGTVKLTDDKQIDSSKIKFGFRGGRLDLNGTTIGFTDINAADEGARIVNHNTDKKSIVNIDTFNFKRHSSIFHGVFGEFDENKPNGELDINIGGTQIIGKSFAVTGGANLNGDINVTSGNTTLILAGSRELHAGENIKETRLNGDFSTSKFKFNNINLTKDSNFHGGIYSIIEGNINGEGKNNVVLGYVAGESKYIYDETQDTWTQTAVETTLNSKKFEEVTTSFRGNIDLKDNSNLKVGYSHVFSDVNLDNSSANFKTSILTGSINGVNNDVTFKDSYWQLTGDSSVRSLKLDKSRIALRGNTLTKGESFGGLEIENYSGNGGVLFNVDIENGKSDKLNIKNGKGQLEIEVNNTGDIIYGNNIVLGSVEKGDIKLTSVNGDNYTDFGAVRAEIGLEDSNIKLNVGNKLVKNTASDMSNAGLSNFAAKTSLIKSQKSLIEESLTNMTQNNFISGIMYKGNYSESKFESDNFREFEQSTINHGVGIESNRMLNNNWNLYTGLAFLYGKSNLDYFGDYSGDMETYSGNIYGKLKNNDGFYVKGMLGVNYILDKINEEKFDNYSLTFGAGAGVEKTYDGIDIQFGTNLNLYYLSGESYSLKDSFGVSYLIDNKEAYVMEINPEARIAKSFELGQDKKLSLYSGLGYEYNFYINNDGADITVDGLNGKSGVVENGAIFKAGIETQIKDFTVGIEGKYLSGNDNSEKLTGTLKLEMKF